MTHCSGHWSITIFRYVGSSQRVTLLTTIYVIYHLVSEYNFKYIFVKIERSKMLEFSNFQKRYFFFQRMNISINFEHCEFFQKQ